MLLMKAWCSRKKFSINYSKAKTKFCLSLQYNGNESYLYVNKTEIYKFIANDKICWHTFCLQSVSKDFAKDEQNEISVTESISHFIVDHSSIKKEDIPDIHQYLMVKNNIKQCLGLLKKYL